MRGMRAAGGVEPRLGLNAEALCNPVDVVEIGDDLRCVVDGSVVESSRAEPVDVRAAAPLHVVGEPNGEFEERHSRCVETGGAPVCRETIDEVLILDLRPEIVKMGLRSVVALVHL